MQQTASDVKILSNQKMEIKIFCQNAAVSLQTKAFQQKFWILSQVVRYYFCPTSVRFCWQTCRVIKSWSNFDQRFQSTTTPQVK